MYGGFDSRDKLPQLSSDHILRYEHVLVGLSIVHGEAQPHEVGQDGGGTGLCSDGWRARGRWQSLGEGKGHDVGTWWRWEVSVWYWTETRIFGKQSHWGNRAEC